MPSLFRRPGDSSSSDSSSEGANEDTNAPPEDLNLLSRIKTIDSAQSERQVPGSRPAISRNNSQFRDLILHSLLEDKALREAAEHLGKDRSAPEVQELAQTTYRALCQQLSGQYEVDKKYASDEMRAHRAAAQEGIDALTRSHLPQLAAQAVGETNALMSHPGAARNISGLENVLSSIPPLLELPLQGYPGIHSDRYAREFVEIATIGRGGYGKVYKVKHKLDDSFYAIKRIMVSPARLQKIKEHGPKEMESMLNEVRALARFDHSNVVRYHNAWLEFISGQMDVSAPPTAFVRIDRLLENGFTRPDSVRGVDKLPSNFNNLCFEDSLSDEGLKEGLDVVFETSDRGGGQDDTSYGPQSASSNDARMTEQRRSRCISNATIETMSSSRSQMSTIHGFGEEIDEDVEVIPRSYQPVPQDTSSDFSPSMLSHSDIPGHLISTRASGPILTLNVQMSLYDTNLGEFLSVEQNSLAALSNPTSVQIRHCFHPHVSLDLLTKVLAGVEYLHAEGVVHRDLKPANIFLSLSASNIAPSGSVDLASCHDCPTRTSLHINPRIGDFGLVAALGDGCLTSDTAKKPVGTELYRPESVVRVNEKLDVFALGIIGFEMLWRCGTRMERIDAIMRLRRGELPSGFADVVGGGVPEIIQGMVCTDDNGRWSCEKVKTELWNAMEGLRQQQVGF
ncbi:eukaryotic translation initiation factor 2-alpha kinase 2 [Lindgomyces ingoldianus]|uniref:Eukaryotic translation initiation factor 2-alpha kinase 2 n=1 Tax=Lindgomyces ingoldianus TaxID=673940 RepID=A0ACB6QZL6_9PLEO|nr:eukaryotic translation initiation factor 2-alpha kinase 2 [Lindgomyces ingoldianus]KAF2471985.1 eukaryotic translation initiation factor 2-alpha kinase 2 [Lindgomyces ingoldianus]